MFESIEIRNKLLDLFYKANSQFLQINMSNILLDVREESLCSSLKTEIDALKTNTIFSEYFTDTEYNLNRGSDDKKRIKAILDNDLKIVEITCDLILHSRGKILTQDNLLALEMKKKKNKKGLESDRIRLKSLTKSSYDNDVWSYDGISLPEFVCRYLIGIMYIIDARKKEITLEIYSKGECMSVETKSFDYYIQYGNIGTLAI